MKGLLKLNLFLFTIFFRIGHELTMFMDPKRKGVMGWRTLNSLVILSMNGFKNLRDYSDFVDMGA